MSRRYRILALTRSIGPTSMPWNDLYRKLRGSAPGVAYPPLVVQPNASDISRKHESCLGERRAYFRGGVVSACMLIRRLAKRRLPLILHLHNPVLGFLMPFVGRNKGRTKVVLNLHTDYRRFRAHQKVGMRLAARRADAIVCVSSAIIDSLPGSIRNPRGRERQVRAICNGVDLSLLPKPPSARDGTRIVIVARIESVKNWRFVLELAGRLPECYRIEWYGDGRDRKALENTLRELELCGRIELKGMVARRAMLEDIAGAGFYLSASQAEGIGVANIEACALGLIPLVSEIPAHREIGETIGFETLPLDCPDAWVERIRMVSGLSDDELSRRRGRLIRESRASYDLVETVARYLKVYDELAANVERGAGV